MIRVVENELIYVEKGRPTHQYKSAGIFTRKLISLDEVVKIPAVYLNYKKYRWVKDLTVKSE